MVTCWLTIVFRLFIKFISNCFVNKSNSFFNLFKFAKILSLKFLELFWEFPIELIFNVWISFWSSFFNLLLFIFISAKDWFILFILFWNWFISPKIASNWFWISFIFWEKSSPLLYFLSPILSNASFRDLVNEFRVVIWCVNSFILLSYSNLNTYWLLSNAFGWFKLKSFSPDKKFWKLFKFFDCIFFNSFEFFSIFDSIILNPLCISFW